VALQEGGLTPLHIAIGGSAPQMVRVLLDALADPDARAVSDDLYLGHFLVSSLHARICHIHMMRDLLDRKLKWHCGRAYRHSLHCALASGAVYCNRFCMYVCVCGGRAVSVTRITRNCMHRSSPNWVCRWK